jgi:hypothetical protein
LISDGVQPQRLGYLEFAQLLKRSRIDETADMTNQKRFVAAFPRTRLTATMGASARIFLERRQQRINGCNPSLLIDTRPFPCLSHRTLLDVPSHK